MLASKQHFAGFGALSLQFILLLISAQFGDAQRVDYNFGGQTVSSVVSYTSCGYYGLKYTTNCTGPVTAYIAAAQTCSSTGNQTCTPYAPYEAYTCTGQACDQQVFKSNNVKLCLVLQAVGHSSSTVGSLSNTSVSAAVNSTAVNGTSSTSTSPSAISTNITESAGAAVVTVANGTTVYSAQCDIGITAEISPIVSSDDGVGWPIWQIAVVALAGAAGLFICCACLGVLCWLSTRSARAVKPTEPEDPYEIKPQAAKFEAQAGRFDRAGQMIPVMQPGQFPYVPYDITYNGQNPTSFPPDAAPPAVYPPLGKHSAYTQPPRVLISNMVAYPAGYYVPQRSGRHGR